LNKTDLAGGKGKMKRFTTSICFGLIFIFMLTFVGCNNKKHEWDPRIIWQYNISDTYFNYTSPVLTENEQVIYIGTGVKEADTQSDNDRLIALNRDGTLKWEYNTQGAEIKSNLLVKDNNIFFVGDYNRTAADHERNIAMSKTKSVLFAVTSEGSLAWSKEVSGSGQTTGPKYNIVLYENKVIVVTEYIYVFNCDDGTELYKSEEHLDAGGGYPGNSGLLLYIRAFLNGNAVYFVYGNYLYIFNMQSYQVDTFDIRQIIPNPPQMVLKGAISFDSQNNIYLGFHSKYISLDPQYNLRWIYDSQNENISFRSTPVIDEQTGRLYVGTKANEISEFIALSLSNGTLAWSYVTGQDVYSSPALRNGKLYFGSEAKKLHVLTTEGQFFYEVVVNQDLGWPSPIIDSQGILYVGGNRGLFFAIDIN